MKLTRLIKYSGGEDLSQIAKYLSVDLSSALRQIETIFNRLSFSDNMRFFSSRVDFTASQEVEIRNELGKIPSFMIVANVTSVDAVITKGVTVDTEDLLYVKNQSTSAVSADILYFL